MRREEEETEKESALPYLPCKLHLKVAAAFYLSRFLANNEKKERELLMPHCHIHAMAIFGSEFFSIPELSQK